MNKITCDIAIASNTFDQIFKQVVKELNNMGLAGAFFTPCRAK